MVGNFPGVCRGRNQEIGGGNQHHAPQLGAAAPQEESVAQVLHRQIAHGHTAAHGHQGRAQQHHQAARIQHDKQPLAEPAPGEGPGQAIGQAPVGDGVGKQGCGGADFCLPRRENNLRRRYPRKEHQRSEENQQHPHQDIGQLHPLQTGCGFFVHRFIQPFYRPCTWPFSTILLYWMKEKIET